MLSVDEVAKLLEAAPGTKYRAALGVAYGADPRVSEVAHLKADDIDSKRMLIRIKEGTHLGDAPKPLFAATRMLPRGVRPNQAANCRPQALRSVA